MEYINIQIPAPDFSLEEMAKEDAQQVFDLDLSEDLGDLWFNNPQLNDAKPFFYRLEDAFNEFGTKEEQIIYISELLRLIIAKESEVKPWMSESDYANFKSTAAKAKRFFYKQARSIGYNFDTNAFTYDEVNDLNSKVDAILEKLNEIQLGQEILFDDLAELKDDFASLKTDFPLGKRRWYQRAAGVVVSYAGTKGADEVYEILKPLLRDFFIKTAPHLIDRL